MLSILIIVPYDPIYPPMNGGMQRCFHILHQLAKHFELTAIIHQDKESFLKAAEEYPSIAKVQLYSTKDVKVNDVFSLLPLKFELALRYRWYKKQLKGPADGSFLKYYPVVKKLLKEKKHDVVILENLATLNAIPTIRKYDERIKIIYDAHNVDTNLSKAAFKKGEISEKRMLEVSMTEHNLYKEVDALFTCSQNDKEGFAALNKNRLLMEVIPNGVSVPDQTFDKGVNMNVPEYILFCGSLWSIPNAEGLQWFADTVWPLVINQFPHLKLLIVGSGELPEKYSGLYQKNSFEFSGAVPDVKPCYNKAGIAVVPLLTGSGTRLKILEAMGLGVPVISTTIGAEGIHYTEGKDILIADKGNEFAERIIELLNDKTKRLFIRSNARSLVKENYDWNIVGNKMATFLKNKFLI